MNEERTVPVTMGVLIQRIKRKLGHDDRRLRTARRWFSDFGHYYVLGFKDNWIVTRQRRPRSAGPRPWRAERSRATAGKLELLEHVS